VKKSAAMSTVSLRPPVIVHAPAPLWRRLARVALLTVGWILIVIGGVGALLPGHLGLPFLVIGLIIVLRSSIQARRQFIGLQRRHPRFVFPIRRLLRREPEVFPVAWQQALRIERFFLPRGWRPARVLRRRIFGRGRRSA
jgi:hypothetical protein